MVFKMITESFQMSENQTNGSSIKSVRNYFFVSLDICTRSAYFKGYMRRATSIPGQ